MLSSWIASHRTPELLCQKLCDHNCWVRLQQPILLSPSSAIKWSRRVRLKSPGMEKTSLTPICTKRRAKWLPRVASDEAMSMVGATDACFASIPKGFLLMNLALISTGWRTPFLINHVKAGNIPQLFQISQKQRAIRTWIQPYHLYHLLIWSASHPVLSVHQFPWTRQAQRMAIEWWMCTSVNGPRTQIQEKRRLLATVRQWRDECEGLQS